MTHIETGEHQYFYPARNQTLLNEPFRISQSSDVALLLQLLKDKDNLEHVHQTENLSWISYVNLVKKHFYRFIRHILYWLKHTFSINVCYTSWIVSYLNCGFLLRSLKTDKKYNVLNEKPFAWCLWQRQIIPECPRFNNIMNMFGNIVIYYVLYCSRNL